MLRSLLPAATRTCACAQTASCLQAFPLRHQSSSSAAAARPGGAVDHYLTLGIRPSASLEDVKRAFREQAKLYHPDVARATTNEAEALARFKLVNEAYSILGDAGACVCVRVCVPPPPRPCTTSPLMITKCGTRSDSNDYALFSPVRAVGV